MHAARAPNLNDRYETAYWKSIETFAGAMSNTALAGAINAA